MANEKASKNHDDNAKQVQLDVVRREREREWNRKESFEKRGITVITASGVFVTLIFGFAASVTKSHNFANFTFVEKLLLGIALGLFIVAGFIALVTNIPGAINAPLLQDRVYRPQDDDTIKKAILEIEDLEKVNASKATCLVVAILVQLLAILMLGGTVIAIVI